ncbi:MAG TPA: response regulator transcription factor, partial [Jiangellales bacterium]|nr:response regulator transcription factor [Jiangellales bacterium]
GEAADGLQAVAAAEVLDPDVVLMDVQMPVMDGITATRELAIRGDRPRVLVLTTFDLDEYVFEALCAGASGFLLKDSTPARLVTAIEAVAAGDSLFAPSVTRRLVERYAATPRMPQAGGPLGDLTDREREVLALLAKGLSNAEISERLVVSLPTVKTHVGRVLLKLGLRDRVQAVVFAYEAGVVRAGEGP